MIPTWRLLLSCASEQVHADLFEPGLYESWGEAKQAARAIEAASPGVIVYVVPSGSDARQVLAEKGHA